MKKELKEKYIQNKLNKWRIPSYIVLFLLIFTLIFFVLQIFRINWELNFPLKLIKNIDNISSDGIRTTLYSLNYAYLVSIIPMSIFIFRRLFSKKHKKEFIDNIELPEKYK